MWSLLCYLLFGWFISSVALHIGERRGVRTTNPCAELPGITAWWNTFTAPIKAIVRVIGAVISWFYELAWRMIKG